MTHKRHARSLREAGLTVARTSIFGQGCHDFEGYLGNVGLRIVVVKDLNLGIVHAVLVAYHDGKAWMLDSEVKQILATDRILHYRPYYSINEDGRWLHKT